MQPYRAPASVSTSRAPSELNYLPSERGDGRPGFLTAVQIAGLPTAAGVLMWMELGVSAGVAAAAVVLAVMIWRKRRDWTPGVLLKVEAGELRVHARGAKKPSWRVALASLEDVVLETKTMERIVEGGSANLGATYLNPRIAPPTDANRIVLESSDGGSFRLTDEFLGHSETLEWFGKIRVFLRKGGWVPASEREAKSEPPIAE